MEIRQYEIWLADLNPASEFPAVCGGISERKIISNKRIGTEPGKTRPVMVVQTDLLNKILHPSTLICPVTSNVIIKSDLLRVHLKKGMANLHQECDIIVDQLRAIDNRRLIKKIGDLPGSLVDTTRENLRIVLDL